MSKVIRKIDIDSTLNALNIQRTTVREMNEYFSREKDHEKIRDQIKEVFGMGLKTVFDPETNKKVEMYVRTGFSEQVDAGVVEAITVGFAPKVVNPLASLFTERGQRYTLVTEGERDTTNAEKLLEENRKRGQYNHNIISSDEYSIRNGSSGFLMDFARNSMQYQYITADQVYVQWPEEIYENDQQRAVETNDVEDAYMILIRLNQVDLNSWNYVAIFARSTDYPLGRYVQFKATEDTYEVPPLNAEGAIEYEVDGVQCNPLSKFADENPDMMVPEYPFVVIHGGTTEGDLMPISTSLYEDSLAFDVNVSHVLGTASDAARGVNVFERTEEGTGKPLPRAVASTISTEAGITFKHESLEADASQTVMNVIKDMMIHLASGYSVPDFMVVSEDHALEASSGVALQVKSRPLIKAREKRVEQNYSAVHKIFEVEKIYIKMFSDAPDSDKNLLLECNLIWDPGEFKLPENRKEKAERIALLGKEGIYDLIAKIRDWHDLATDEEAIELYEKMKERKEKYPPLNQDEQQGQLPGRTARRPFGLLRNQNGDQGQQQ